MTHTRSSDAALDRAIELVGKLESEMLARDEFGGVKWEHRAQLADLYISIAREIREAM
jgi:hypothetical protein